MLDGAAAMFREPSLNSRSLPGYNTAHLTHPTDLTRVLHELTAHPFFRISTL